MEELKRKEIKAMLETREFLKKLDCRRRFIRTSRLLKRDLKIGGPVSRLEVPGYKVLGTMRALLESLDEYGVFIHRVG